MRTFPAIACALGLSLSLSLAGAVHAGTTGGSGPVAVRPLKLTEYVSLKVQNHGPDKAEGVVYFLDGLDPSNRVADNFLVTYPYVYELNTKHGWDVISAKFPNSEHDAGQSLQRASEYVYARIRELKAQGYRRIVLGGQSWGAWVSIDVARHDVDAKVVDALLLTAPAFYGTKYWRGKENASYYQNLTEYVKSIKHVRTPTVATFFQGDEFDPGTRGDITAAFYAQNDVPLMLFDNPPGFAGHGAGWLPSFADVFGGCMAAFFKAPEQARCEVDAARAVEAATPSEYRVKADSAAEPVRQTDLVDKSFILVAPTTQVRLVKFGRGKLEVATAAGSSDFDLAADDSRTCLDDGCYRAYRLKDGRLVAFDESGAFRGWLDPVK